MSYLKYRSFSLCISYLYAIYFYTLDTSGFKIASNSCCYVAQVVLELLCSCLCLQRAGIAKPVLTGLARLSVAMTEASNYNCNTNITIGSSVCPVFISCPKSALSVSLSLACAQTFSCHAILIRAVVTWHSLLCHDQCFSSAASIILEKLPPFGAV